MMRVDMGVMTGFQMFLVIIAVIAIVFFGYQLFMWWMRRQNAEVISQEDFRLQMHNAQVIDVREPAEYQSAHILGARNIPYSQTKIGAPGLSKTRDIFLYDDGVNVATRMAKFLKKQGYERIFILEDGFNEWRGKVKRKGE